MRGIIWFWRSTAWPFLRCHIFHRDWVHGPIDGWPSSQFSECRVCGFTYAEGVRSWAAWNHRKE